MISLLQLNNITKFIIFFTILVLNSTYVIGAVDIWKNQEKQTDQNSKKKDEKKITIQSPILSGDVNKISIIVDEEKILETEKPIIGIFDPEDNNFHLNMWVNTDGEEIKKILRRINKLKLSKLSEDLLFQVLFTNAYPPKNNLTSNEFLKIKINWLIKNKRFKDLETLLKINPVANKESKAVKILINEYLSSADVKTACKKVNLISKSIQNNYLDKFKIYCLIYEDRKDEAQLLLDLAKERGLKDNFFEKKINFLLGITENTNQKIVDNNLLNFYLSHITNDEFDYQPTDKTDQYIWRYLSSANLIQIDDLESEEVITTYEQAAEENSFGKDEIFKIYLKIPFNFNQLLNAQEIYKNLPNYKARALIYQSIKLSDNIEHKLYLTFLLKDLFVNDNLFKAYSDEFLAILKSIDPTKIPENYSELVEKSVEKNSRELKKVKFDNEILHRSKVIRHFLDNYKRTNRTEKDLKTVYKKIKKNKKYFISIKDIIVLESLAADGVSLPKDLDFAQFSSELTVPKSLEDLVKQDQIGLVMLKMIEIIGEDSISDLDPETIYFLNSILNDLNLKEIRNNILSQALPVRV